MIVKFDDFLNEAAQIVFPHSEDGSRVAKFKVIASPTSLNNVIRFIAASSKDLDQLDGVRKEVVLEAILKYANKQFRDIKFVPIKYDDDGAGYGIKIDLEPIMKRLNK
jgi:hypothetical protein